MVPGKCKDRRKFSSDTPQSRKLTDLVSNVFPGPHGDNFLQFLYLGAVLLGCNATDHI